MRALIVLVLAASVAHADDIDTTYVSGELRGTTAVLHARYTLKVVGPTYAWGTSTLLIPEGAAVTNVVVTAPDGTHRLDLLEAEKAQKKFEAINDTYGGKRWAMLVEWHGLSIDVSYAAPHDATLSIDVELQMPTCFDRDVRYAQVPVSWKLVLSPYLRRRLGRNLELGRCRIDQGGDLEELFVAFPSAELARKPAGPDRVGANAARIDLGEAHVARLEIAIAKTLGEVPRDLSTVIVVDGSRSMTPVQLEAQRELVKAYVRVAGETQVQLVAYARTARALLPSWTSARSAMTRLDRELRAIAPRNGSNLDAGLVEAARWLEKTSGTKRVLLLTDNRLGRDLRARFDSLYKSLAPDVLVHVVRVDEEPGLERDLGFGDTLAEPTGGMAVRVGLPEDGTSIDATMLVRPIRIDGLDITAPGWKRFSNMLQTTCDSALDEGQACTWWGEGDAVAGPLAIEGKIWGKRFVRVVTPDGSRMTELARELSTMNVLDTDAFDRAQKLSRAASNAWSFYAEWGQRGGYELGSMSLHGSGRCCHQSSSMSPPQVRIGHSGFAPLPIVDLSPQFEHVIARCGLGEGHVEASIELTGAEIVDVRVLAPPQVSRCVEDEIWDTAVSPPPQQLFQISSRIVLVH